MNISDISSIQSLASCFGAGNNLKISMILEVEELEANISSVLKSLKNCNTKADINIRLVALGHDKVINEQLVDGEEEICN